MSQTTFLRPRQRWGASIHEADGSFFLFDATVSESPTHEGSLTKHPVEDGADVSDHYQNEPDTLALVCGLTNSPLPAQGEPEQNRDVVLYKDLVAIKDRGEPITVVTGIDVYENMVITRITFTRDPQTGQALLLNLDLEEVILTTTESVDIPPERQRRKGGRQNAAPVHSEGDITAEEAALAQTEGLQASVESSAAAEQAAEDPEAKATRDKNTSELAATFGS